ncbi:MAG TPA: hypothetical protein VEB86_07605, partial [Chryseosolibacter sp.]|nr:hypothetical protein [Chryseosolibacter sp.]
SSTEHDKGQYQHRSMPPFQEGRRMKIFHTFRLQVFLNIEIKINYGVFVLKIMKKMTFKILANINKIILPRYSKRNLANLSKLDKALIAYRYWVTINAL